MIDTDNSGEIDIDEYIKAWRTYAEPGIDAKKSQNLAQWSFNIVNDGSYTEDGYDVMDDNKDGDVDHDEFERHRGDNEPDLEIVDYYDDYNKEVSDEWKDPDYDYVNNRWKD